MAARLDDPWLLATRIHQFNSKKPRECTVFVATTGCLECSSGYLLYVVHLSTMAAASSQYPPKLPEFSSWAGITCRHHHIWGRSVQPHPCLTDKDSIDMEAVRISEMVGREGKETHALIVHSQVATKKKNHSQVHVNSESYDSLLFFNQSPTIPLGPNKDECGSLTHAWISMGHRIRQHLRDSTQFWGQGHRSQNATWLQILKGFGSRCKSV